MIVATAGHIDHGKTSLVTALTGVDTDRLPEEKRRGMTIDLGFAYWRDSDDVVLGFVDVPGHDRFVHTMVAGVGAVDYAMLVVAADDGPGGANRLGRLHGRMAILRGAQPVVLLLPVAPGWSSGIRVVPG